MQTAWIIAIGTELALGQTVDTNSAWLAQRLAERGIRTLRHLTVPDELAEILGVLAAAAGHCDLLILTGGLGPTDDDLTRQALADAAGVPLEPHAQSLDQIRAYFAARGRPMHEANYGQSLLPIGAEALPNSCGTAPGVCIRLGELPCFALPGVPAEMQAMFLQEVAPRLQGGGRVVAQRLLHCLGEGEAAIGAKIRDLMARGRNPEIGTTAKAGIIGIRINATADAPPAAQHLLDHAEAELRTRLGRIVFGRDDDTIAGVVGGLLVDRSATLALAESCTAGLIAKLVTDVPGSSRYFIGGVIAYANSVKTSELAVDDSVIQSHGAVSAEIARLMAENVRRQQNATYGIGVTGIAGPDGGTEAKPIGTVFIALAGPEGNEARKLQLGADSGRALIRERAATTALDMLRLRLLG